jgi:hypothetical protein
MLFLKPLLVIETAFLFTVTTAFVQTMLQPILDYFFDTIGIYSRKHSG